MTRLILALLAVGQVATVKPTVVNPNEWSYYDVIRAPGSVTVNGVIADKEWGRARAITGFRDVFQPERAVIYPTAAKMMWDDKYLYVAFECMDEDIWAEMSKRDDPIYCEQAVEVFIDPEGQGQRYFEIDVSPANVVVDLMLLKGSYSGRSAINARYNVKGLLTAAKVYGTLDNRSDKDEKWTVEMAIPWSEFRGRKVNVPPRDGDSWRVQLFRIDRPAPFPAENQHLCWSKSPGVFHQPKNFGVVIFRQ